MYEHENQNVDENADEMKIVETETENVWTYEDGKRKRFFFHAI